MKRTFNSWFHGPSLIILCLSAVWATSLPSISTASEPQKDPQVATQPEATQETRRHRRFAKKFGAQKPPQFPRSSIISAQHQIEHLRGYIKADLELSKEQAKDVDRIIDRLILELETGERVGDTLEPSAVRLQREQERPMRIRNARDMQRFREFGRMKGASALAPAGITPFSSRAATVEALAPLFHGTQVEEFKRVVARWDALEPPVGIPDGAMMRLRRSVLDPKLPIEPAQREEFGGWIGKRMLEFGRDRFDDAKTTAAADELRTKILEQLTPRQQEHLIATNKALNADAKLLQEKIAEAEAEAKKDAESDASDKENPDDEPTPAKPE